MTKRGWIQLAIAAACAALAAARFLGPWGDVDPGQASEQAASSQELPSSTPAPQAPYVHKAMFRADWSSKTKRPGLANTPAPQWNLTDWHASDGLSLEGLRGKIVVLYFWGSWCGACKLASPHVSEIYEENKAAGVEFVGIHTVSQASDMPATARRFGLAFPTAVDVGDRTGEAYGCPSYPYCVVIDRKGIVRLPGARADALGSILIELLLEQPLTPDG